MPATNICHSPTVSPDGSLVATVGGGEQGWCDVIWIAKKLADQRIVETMDAIGDGHIAVPIAADAVVVAFCGTKDFGLPGGKDVTYLYGVRSDGSLVCAFPPLEYAHGRRLATYKGNNTVLVQGDGDPGRLYCWSGKDWTQGDGPGGCDANHTCQLVALRTAGGPPHVIRQEFGPPL